MPSSKIGSIALAAAGNFGNAPAFLQRRTILSRNCLIELNSRNLKRILQAELNDAGEVRIQRMQERSASHAIGSSVRLETG